MLCGHPACGNGHTVLAVRLSPSALWLVPGLTEGHDKMGQPFDPPVFGPPPEATVRKRSAHAAATGTSPHRNRLEHRNLSISQPNPTGSRWTFEKQESDISGLEAAHVMCPVCRRGSVVQPRQVLTKP